MELSRVHLDQLSVITDKVVTIERRLKEVSKSNTETIRLWTAPGIGPVSAMAIKACSPPLEGFKRGRDYAAWLELVPVQKSTGGKQILGKTSKMGLRDIRRLGTKPLAPRLRRPDCLLLSLAPSSSTAAAHPAC